MRRNGEERVSERVRRGGLWKIDNTQRERSTVFAGYQNYLLYRIPTAEIGKPGLRAI